MRIALVGGSGFVGSRLAPRLVNAGHAVTVLDQRRPVGEEIEYARLDVRDKDAVIEALRGHDAIINLAAVHRDDVRPRSLYDDVNIGGAKNVCAAARANSIERIVFTSSIAVYGFAPSGTDETGEMHPFNDYGRTKMEAEAVYRGWLDEDVVHRSLTIVRPTVVFGERNRGNVYNLLRQIAGRNFVMVGRGDNCKSMAYVENVAAFLAHCLSLGCGEHLHNYVDKPDFNMNELVGKIYEVLGRKRRIRVRIPYWTGYTVGVLFDGVARATHHTFPISAIRVKKFCSETKFESSAARMASFDPPVSLSEGLERTIRYEFLESHNGEAFYSE